MGAPEADVLTYLLLECNLIELMLSIGEQGYFAGEPLLVVPDSSGAVVVVEGNRRLGALKLLQDGVVSKVMPKQVDQARAGAKNRPNEIPVLEFSSRDEILAYLGYRHITGIKEWDALAKARYLQQLRMRYKELDHEAAHKVLAREIGSKASYVSKLLTGLTLLERARDSGLLNQLRIEEQDIPFSLLTTGIGYEGICKFIGLSGPSDVDIENIKDAEFGEFFKWVFEKLGGSNTVLGESRNFNKLARVVANDQALNELRKGKALDAADLFTSGPLEAIRQLMQDADIKIADAQAALSLADGFDGGDISQADRLRKAAAALHGAIQELVGSFGS